MYDAIVLTVCSSPIFEKITSAILLTATNPKKARINHGKIFAIEYFTFFVSEGIYPDFF